MSVRVLPEQSPRVETGPVRFGDDWTGVFIRGDNAFGYIMAIDRALALAAAGEPLTMMRLRSLRDEFAACVEGPVGQELRSAKVKPSDARVLSLLQSDDGARAMELVFELRRTLARHNLLKPGVAFGGIEIQS